MKSIKLAITCNFRTREYGKWAEVQPVDCDKDDVRCENANSQQYPTSHSADELHCGIRGSEDLLGR